MRCCRRDIRQNDDGLSSAQDRLHPASTDHGTLIVNRFDYRMVDATTGFGVGYFLLEYSSYEPQEGSIAMQLLALRRRHFGDGVIAVDCGAKSACTPSNGQKA